MMVALAPPGLPKPRPLPMVGARPTMPAMLGDLARSGASVLKLELPSGLDAQDLEILVQVRQGGRVLAEGTLKKPTPGAGLTSKYSVELKRG